MTIKPRLVIALFGPPAAGKTTVAQSCQGLTIYDRDDPQWARSGGHIRYEGALYHLGNNPNAHAIVVATHPTSAGRAQLQARIKATHAYMLDPGKPTCHRQAKHRPGQGTHRAIHTWYELHDHHDYLPPWPGWDPTTQAPHTHPPHTGPITQGGTTTRGWDYQGSRAW